MQGRARMRARARARMRMPGNAASRTQAIQDWGRASRLSSVVTPSNGSAAKGRAAMQLSSVVRCRLGALAVILSSWGNTGVVRAAQDDARASDARVDRTPDYRHRLGAAAGASLTLVAPGDNLGTGLLLRPQYAYRLVRGLELGVGVTYWSMTGEAAMADRFYAFVPALSVRPYADLNEARTIELGLSLSAGLSLLFARSSSDPWVGYGLAARPDVRVWSSSRFAFELGVEGSFSRGYRDTDFDPETREAATVLTGGPWIGGLGRF